MKNQLLTHKWFTVGLSAVVVFVAVLLLWVETSRAPAPSEAPPSGSETSIEGEVVCLPHKNPDGPQTLECAFGVKLDDGTYYGLRDSSDEYQNVSKLPTGQRARLTGTLKEESSDNYQSTGTFTVTDAKVIE